MEVENHWWHLSAYCNSLCLVGPALTIFRDGFLWKSCGSDRRTQPGVASPRYIASVGATRDSWIGNTATARKHRHRNGPDSGPTTQTEFVWKTSIHMEAHRCALSSPPMGTNATAPGATKWCECPIPRTLYSRCSIALISLEPEKPPRTAGLRGRLIASTPSSP
jgi:hypothetical protein